MKKLVFLLLLLKSLLIADSMYTLDHIKNLSVYIASKTSFIGNEERVNIKKIIETTLSESGFVFDKPDPIDLVVEISSKEFGDEFAININFILAQEVSAIRGTNSVKTFANVYQNSLLISSDNPYKDTLESIDILLLEFVKSYKEDNSSVR